MVANTLSEVTVASSVGMQTPGPPPGTHQLPAAVMLPIPVLAQCYDRDKQGWTIKSDCHSETVRLHMVYKDIHNVARNHLRYTVPKYCNSPKGTQSSKSLINLRYQLFSEIVTIQKHVKSDENF
jgi:hypothetical protein